ncbi:unnamed protein product [Oikopleura dioica]|uniref:UPAR/Ly6 domain-containing protein n=1 Tax=Oikopleura dioica TaxID=34765 RepID=E4Y755_OIKDI|nr:unnamed protein product [Oikopleura dioica]
MILEWFVLVFGLSEGLQCYQCGTSFGGACDGNFERTYTTCRYVSDPVCYYNETRKYAISQNLGIRYPVSIEIFREAGCVSRKEIMPTNECEEIFVGRVANKLEALKWQSFEASSSQMKFSLETCGQTCSRDGCTFYSLDSAFTTALSSAIIFLFFLINVIL